MDDEKRQAVEERFRRGCARYAEKLAAGRGGLRRDGKGEEQARNYVAGSRELQRVRSDTAAVLDVRGVSMIVRPFYYSFALALGKRVRHSDSEGLLAAEGRVLILTWERRGLVRAVLIAIARDVFNLNLNDPNPGSCAVS